MRLFLTVAAAVLVSLPAYAQFSIGGQVGDPTGLAVKAGAGRGALLLAVGWDLNDSVSAEGHYVLSNRRVQGADANVGLFYGPGVFLKTGDESDTRFGVSLGIELEGNLTREIEVYGLVSPRLQLVESTGFDLGGGIGLRLRL